MQTNRNVAMLMDDLRGCVEAYGPGTPVAAEAWHDIASPGGDEPIARAYFDGDAGYVVLETLRRFRRGAVTPLGMGRRADESRADKEGYVSVEMYSEDSEAAADEDPLTLFAEKV